MDWRKGLWTPQAGYAVALLCLCIAWGSTQRPERTAGNIPTALRPATPVRAPQPTPCPEVTTDLPDDPEDRSYDPTIGSVPAVPERCPDPIVIRPKPLVMLGGQVTFPLGASVDVRVRWGRFYIGPVWAIIPQGYGLRLDFPLF